jgi:hypothetical protein
LTMHYLTSIPKCIPKWTIFCDDLERIWKKISPPWQKPVDKHQALPPRRQQVCNIKPCRSGWVR